MAAGKKSRVKRPAGKAGSLLRKTQAALREAEARFRSITQLSADWYWEQDDQFRLTYMSNQLSEKTGLDVQSYIGRTRWNRPALNLTEIDWARHRAQLERHEPFRDFEMQRARSDGRTVWVSISGEPVFDEVGRFKGYRGIGRDITERKRAEDDMRRFRLAMDSSADMIALVDRATMRYVDVNTTICRVLGYTREEMLSMSPADIVPMPRAELERAYDALIANPTLATGLRSTYRCKDGTLLPFESNRQVHRSGESWIIVAISRDIRDRVSTEAALRASEERFRHLTDLSSDWYWEQDAELRFVSTGGGTEARGGITPEAHIGKRRWELPNTDILGQTWADHEAVLMARKPFRDLLLRRTHEQDDNARYVSVAGMPIFDEHGVFLGYRGVASDVTERVRGEQLLRLEHQVARQLSEAEDAAAGVRGILRLVCESEAWGCGRYFALDESSGLLRYRDGWFTDERFQKFIEQSQAITFASGQGLAGLVMRDGEPLWSTDASGDPRIQAKQLSGSLGIRGAFAFAVVSEGKRIGVLSFSTTALRKPDRRLLQATSVIGSQIGQFLERKRAEHALRESEERFRTLAYSDPLTGLANRTSLGAAFEQAVERARRRGARIATMFLDLDGFKQLNDVHGHEAGDRFLVETARRLRASVRASDLVARLGGDEFFVVVEDQQEAESVDTVARKLLGEIMEPFEIVPGQQARISASIGISVFPDDAPDAATLMKHADTAMYQAKQAGKNAFRVFRDEAPARPRSESKIS